MSALGRFFSGLALVMRSRNILAKTLAAKQSKQRIYFWPDKSGAIHR